MDILGKDKLVKLKRKNRGNKKLADAVDKLIADFENADWNNRIEVKQARKDADCVHNDGFYFFDINIHRIMILVIFEKGEAIVVWTGSHSEYDRVFKGNKSTIEKWLRNQELI